MTKPDMILFKGGTRIPECGICAGTLRQDDAGWYCEKCGLRYKFVARYRDEEAQARSRASVQKLTDATKVLLEGFQRLNCPPGFRPGRCG